MIEFFLSIVLFFITGSIGWFFAQYIGGQVNKFYELRSNAIEIIYFVSNIGPLTLEQDRERYIKASDELRRCAARFDALRKNATKLTEWYLNVKKYDIGKTVSGLTGLSNSISLSNYPRYAAQHRVEIGLRLMPSLTVEELEEEKKLHQQGLK